jgi:hypothetical protein
LVTFVTFKIEFNCNNLLCFFCFDVRDDLVHQILMYGQLIVTQEAPAAVAAHNLWCLRDDLVHQILMYGQLIVTREAPTAVAAHNLWCLRDDLVAALNLRCLRDDLVHQIFMYNQLIVTREAPTAVAAHDLGFALSVPPHMTRVLSQICSPEVTAAAAEVLSLDCTVHWYL